MARVIFHVAQDKKELWVELAAGEQISLGEWIRRACEQRAHRVRKGTDYWPVPAAQKDRS